MSTESVIQRGASANGQRMSYSEQLKNPQWQRKRLECLEAAEWTCEVCMGSELTLHVHHKHYVKGRMAWEYPRSELAVLCEECHKGAHEEWALRDYLFALLPMDGPGSQNEAFSVAAGFVSVVNGYAKPQSPPFSPACVAFGRVAGELVSAVGYRGAGALADAVERDPAGFGRVLVEFMERSK